LLLVTAALVVGFAVSASLALFSHYFSVLFLTALAGAWLLVVVIRPDYRRALARALPRRWRADLLCEGARNRVKESARRQTLRVRHWQCLCLQ